MPEHDDIRDLFADWDAALQTGDAEQVAALYAPDAVLLPTFSDRVRTTDDGRRDYFDAFLRRRPRASLEEAHARVFGDVAILSGVYAFVFGAGPDREARARFTFVYHRVDGRWWIVEHHSSGMPEETSSGMPEEVAERPPKSGA